jgi:pyruvate/2-oxoglutarate/acetoin dehydrogenase E1 component
MKYLESIRNALDYLLANDEKVYIIGEDILDPYGGAFKATKGLSSKYPDRLLSSPISESLIVGFGTGMAIRGYRPIVEIMFGDFLGLCFDQILNSATKFPLMYKSKVKVPLVIRTPMGGGRGYGPTHSQSIEKHFLGIPGLNVVCPSIFHDPGKLLISSTIEDEIPVLFIENKILYSKDIYSNKDQLQIEFLGNHMYPTAIIKNFSTKIEENDIIIFTYGGISDIIKDIMIDYMDEEIKIIAVCPCFISSFDFLDEIPNISYENILIIEEGTEGFNWASELSSKLYDKLYNKIKHRIQKISPKSDIIPSSKEKEDKFLPNIIQIKEKIINMLS